MQTRTSLDLNTAVSQILDTLMQERRVTLDYSGTHAEQDGIAPILTLLHDQARHRGTGVSIEYQEGDQLCLSLRYS